MIYDNIIYDDLIKEKIEQLVTLKKSLLDIRRNIKNNVKGKDIILNMNNKLINKIDKIDNLLSNVIDCMAQYVSEINILNNNIITNHSDFYENIYIRKIMEMIENDL